MNRKALLLTTNPRTKISICIDEKNADEIIAYINQDMRHKKKWDFISNIILENLKIPEVFDKESINSRCKDVYAMKFFKGQENDRIYCKKIKQEDGSSVIIVASELHLKKKVQKNSAREVQIIEKVASYEYEIEK